MTVTAAEVLRPPKRALGAWSLVFGPLVVLTGLIVLEVLAERARLGALVAIAGLAVYVGWAWWTLQRARHAGFDIKAFLRPPAQSRDWSLLLIVPALLLVAVAGLYVGFLLLSLVLPETVAGLMARGPSPDAAAPAVIVLLRSIRRVLVGPVVEEILFRGILLHLWAPKLGVRAAVLTSSACFALLHIDPIGSLVFGIVMAGLYVRTRSLLVPIVGHALYNAAVVIPTVAAAGSGGATTLAELRELWPAMVGLLLVSLAIVTLFLRLAVRDRWTLPSVQAPVSTPATAALVNPSHA